MAKMCAGSFFYRFSDGDLIKNIDLVPSGLGSPLFPTCQRARQDVDLNVRGVRLKCVKQVSAQKSGGAGDKKPQGNNANAV